MTTLVSFQRLNAIKKTGERALPPISKGMYNKYSEPVEKKQVSQPKGVSPIDKHITIYNKDYNIKIEHFNNGSIAIIAKTDICVRLEDIHVLTKPILTRENEAGEVQLNDAYPRIKETLIDKGIIESEPLGEYDAPYRKVNTYRLTPEAYKQIKQ